MRQLVVQSFRTYMCLCTLTRKFKIVFIFNVFEEEEKNNRKNGGLYKNRVLLLAVTTITTLIFVLPVSLLIPTFINECLRCCYLLLLLLLFSITISQRTVYYCILFRRRRKKTFINNLDFVPLAFSRSLCYNNNKIMDVDVCRRVFACLSLSLSGL